MCGRFYIDENTATDIQRLVQKIDQSLRIYKAGDIYPSQSATVLSEKSNHISLEDMLWGFPRYYQSGLLINARAETALERKTFRESVQKRRCVIPARHFYEWDSSKNKVTFFLPQKEVLFMGGFYQHFEDGNHFMILTTEANASVKNIHHRMPLILEPSDIEKWIYEDGMTEYYLKKIPAMLQSSQEYEQLSFL